MAEAGSGGFILGRRGVRPLSGGVAGLRRSTEAEST